MGNYMDFIREKQNQAYEDGLKVEDLFVLSALETDDYIDAFEVDKKLDAIEHWDRGLINKNGEKILVDVKGIKGFWIDNFEKKVYTDEYHTIELLAVDGTPGWPYGKADYIAFELKDKFICVSREKLSKVAMFMCVGDSNKTQYFLNLINTNVSNFTFLQKIKRKNKMNKLHDVVTRPGDYIYGGKTLIKDKLYKRYRRKDRFDLTFDVTKKDIENLKEFEIKKILVENNS